MKRSLLITAAVAVMFSVVSCSGSSETSTAPSASTISAAPASENLDQVITRLEHEWVEARSCAAKTDSATEHDSERAMKFHEGRGCKDRSFQPSPFRVLQIQGP